MRVLVVGGGIGGLSAAIALRSRGVDVDVVEINPKWDVYGVGIIQPANAIRALDELGLAEQAVEQGFAMKGSRFHTKDGHLLGEVPALDLLGPKYPPMNGITRPKLHAIFQDAVKASGADIRLGLTADSVGEDGSVAFSDGGSGEYDLVVGADGIHSKVRSLVFPGAPEPEYTGQIVWRYNVPRPDGLETLDMFVGANGKAGFVPLSPELMYILYIEAVPADEVKMPPEQLADIFRKRLAEFSAARTDCNDLQRVPASGADRLMAQPDQEGAMRHHHPRGYRSRSEPCRKQRAEARLARYTPLVLARQDEQGVT